MDFLEGLTTWFAGFAGSEWAVIVLAIATFLESIFSPIPPDPLLIPMSVLRPEMAIWYGLVATISSLMGALVGHWLGSRFGRPILSRFASESKIDLAEIQHFIEQNIQKLSFLGLVAVLVSCLGVWLLVKFRRRLGVS